MAILIDGYNLLNSANIVAEGPGKYSLEKSRRSLLRFLVAVVEPSERPGTTVVFDGREAPLGLPKKSSFQEITILFSEPGTEADDLIEQMIPKYSAPRRLTVVSSDHRIQRAARRRQATAVDSEVWVAQQVAARRLRALRGRRDSSESREAGEGQLSEREVAQWLVEFGDIEIASLESEFAKEPPGVCSEENETAASDGEADEIRNDDQEELKDFNPFPKGYGEDLL